MKTIVQTGLLIAGVLIANCASATPVKSYENHQWENVFGENWHGYEKHWRGHHHSRHLNREHRRGYEYDEGVPENVQVAYSDAVPVMPPSKPHANVPEPSAIGITAIGLAMLLMLQAGKQGKVKVKR